MRFIGFGPSKLNRRICSGCIHALQKRPGGAEIELSLMFADVRGSTQLAERVGSEQFSDLMARFYGIAATAVDRYDGIVDKFVGDEVVALFIPGFAGDDHASDAVSSARDILIATGHAAGTPWLPIGAGVHTGLAFVGVIGEGDAYDFTALGDAVNMTARLASAASTGEILISGQAAQAGGISRDGFAKRKLDLTGVSGTVDAWVVAVT
jgi:adenylate cyclase